MVFLMMGRPLTMEAASSILETGKNRNIWLLRDEYGHSRWSGRRDKVAANYGDIAAFDLSETTDTKSLVSVWCVAEGDEPNAMFWGNSLLILRSLKAGEYITVGVGKAPDKNHPLAKLKGEQWRIEQRPPPPSTFDILTQKQLVSMSRVLVAAQLRLWKDTRAETELFWSCLKDAVRHELVPRLITTFAVSVEVERHPALQFAMDQCSGSMVDDPPGGEMERQRLAAFKELVKERASAEHELCFKIFEIFVKANRVLHEQMPSWQRYALQLGKAALEQHGKYMEPMMVLLLDAVVSSSDEDQSLVTGLCYAVIHVLQLKRYPAHVALARWFESNDQSMKQRLKEASENLKKMVAQWRDMGSRCLKILPLTLQGWHGVCSEAIQGYGRAMSRRAICDGLLRKMLMLHRGRRQGFCATWHGTPMACIRD